MLAEKGQVHVYGGTNSLQAAVSPVNHLGVIAGYSGFRHSYEDGFGREHANLGELGVGYYNAFDSSNNIGFVYDVYGGFGAGKISIDNKPGYAYPSTSVSRIFVQPGIGMRSRIFEASFNVRVSNLSYSNFSLPAVKESPIAGRSYTFAEPAITLRAGYKFVKLELQYVHSTPFSTVGWNYEDDAINMGISVVLGRRR
eukprot:gene15230-biopygen13357